MRIISFTGGLGAQILSAAAYFSLESNCKDIQNVGANLDYFRRVPRKAVPGIKGDISNWDWQLNYYGHKISDFRVPTRYEPRQIIWDGKEKWDLAVKGLATPEISKRFPVVDEAVRIRKKLFGDDTFACIHVRRGDYVNVASYVVPDDSFIRVIRMLTGLTKNFLYVSDSPISEEMRLALLNNSFNCATAIDGVPAVTHSLMRLSTILVCSNSQFSLSAALLRPETSLTVYPSHHDSDPTSNVNVFLGQVREFQLISKANLVQLP
jgi:hypothetical protein